MTTTQQNKKRKNPLRWFFKDQFSFFDGIVIYIMIRILDYVINHLHWS